MDGLIFLLTKSTTNLGKDVNLPWYYCTTEYVRNYTWPWETQLGCSCYWRLKMLTSLSFNFIWHFYDVSTQIWLDKSAHKQIYLMKESLEMSCCWHLESRPNSFCTWASRVKTNWWVSWLQSYNISVVVNTYILYKEHTWRRIEHTHTPAWMWNTGVYLLAHLYYNLQSSHTGLIPQSQMTKEGKKKFQWHIDLEHKYRYATSRLRSTVQKWSYQIQSLFGCFSEMAAVFFF